MPAQMSGILTRRLAEFTEGGSEFLVFTSVKGSPLLNRYFTPCWTKANEKAGIDAAVRFHDLRHAAGTAAASAGGSLKQILARMGHASPDASLRYLKASERRDRMIAHEIGSEIETSHRE